jgi:SAM-dependent methyltransferase
METKLNNISIYNERMDKSIKDKLWFIDKVDANVYVDFGCANGNLLKHLSYIHQKQGKTDIQYIGYDNNDEMLKIARQNCNRFKNISFTNDFVNIRNDYDILNDKKVCLILSSVLHEVYSYSKDLKKKKIFGNLFIIWILIILP